MRQGTRSRPAGDCPYRLRHGGECGGGNEERKEDIPLLAAHFLRQYAAKAGKEIQGFTPETLEMLLNYPWPGNVRQLEKAIERAVIMTQGELVEAYTLPEEVLQATGKDLFPAEALTFREARQRFERDYLITMLRRHQGNVTAAAEAAGIHRTHFYQKMRLYGISEGEYRDTDIGGEAKKRKRDRW